MAWNKNIFVLLLFALFLGKGSGGVALGDAEKPKGSPMLLSPLAAVPTPEPFKWYHSYAEGLKAARAKKLPLLISFHADWCGWCKMMDEETFAAPQVLPRIQGFICIKVNVDHEPNVAFAYQVSSLPRTFLINGHDEIVGDYLGYRDTKDFLGLLDAADEYLKKETGFAKMPVVQEGAPGGGLSAPSAAEEADLVTIDPKDKKQIFELLGQSNSLLRKKVIATLIEQGRDALPLLIKALGDDYLGTRISAWKTLRGLKLSGITLEESAFDPWAAKAVRGKALARLKGIFSL